jgi:hypothetical protein
VPVPEALFFSFLFFSFLFFSFLFFSFLCFAFLFFALHAADLKLTTFGFMKPQRLGLGSSPR